MEFPLVQAALRRCLGPVALVLGAWALCAPAHADGAPPAKVFRYAIRVAETGFDPAQVSDLYSRTIVAGIFDAPLRFDYLARPVRLRPNTAALPEVSEDFKTLTFRLRPGTFFAPDPAFGGRQRELIAADYIYSIKRHYDPKVKSQNLYILENAGILGLSELRKQTLASKKPFDYDREVEGLKLLDRYSFQVRISSGDPRFVNYFADSMMGAQAREVVEYYGDRIMEHPVGSGAWRLVEWRRSSLMVLEKNPNFREEYYQEQPDAANARLVAQAAQLRGRRLPMIDRVEISVIEENQPRWLSFLRKEFDLIDELPQEYTPIAMPKNQLAPNLAKLGMQAVRYPRADIY